MPPRHKTHPKFLAGILSSVVVVVLGGSTLYYSQAFLTRVATFDECVKSGYPMLESFPRQCVAPSGDTFIEEVTTYRNDTIGFSLQYPPEIKIEELPSGNVRFFFIGSTQSEEALSDGISFIVSKIILPRNSSLRDIALRDEKQENSRTEKEDFGSVGEIVLAGRHGYTFTTKFDTTTHFIYLPRTTDSAIKISYFAQDPTHQGFDEIVNNILSSFNVLP